MKLSTFIIIGVLLGIIFGIIFIMPTSGGLTIKKVCTLDLSSTLEYHYNIISEWVEVNEVTLTATGWRTSIAGMSIGYAILNALYGTPLMGILPVTLTAEWELTNLDTGQIWRQKLSYTVPALSGYQLFHLPATFERVPAGNYQLKLRASISISTTTTWRFALTEDQAGIVLTWKK